MRSVFLESTREELLPTLDSLDALDAASGCAQRLVLLIATAGAALSDAAAKLPPLQQPPRGPRPLPGLGNALCFKGPYEVPMYNAWHNLFAPGKQEVWGDTVRLVLPEAFSTSGDSEGAGGWDDELALIETVVTTDPEVSVLPCLPVRGAGACPAGLLRVAGRLGRPGLRAQQGRLTRSRAQQLLQLFRSQCLWMIVSLNLHITHNTHTYTHTRARPPTCGRCRFISSPSKSALKGLHTHSLNRSVRPGRTTALNAMMDTRCRLGCLLKSTTSPFCGGSGGCKAETSRRPQTEGNGGGCSTPAWERVDGVCACLPPRCWRARAASRR
jgi:hypothetical protein